MPKPLHDLVAPDWAEALSPVASKVTALGSFLREEMAAGHPYLPAGDAVLRAFTLPLADVRVLVIGQDPYPTPGHPVGLSFSVAPDVRPLPGSLRNIYKELEADLGIAPAEHGDLSHWFGQGVLLLNRVLTVRPGAPASHRGKGWEEVTACAVEALARRGGPLVAILWGVTRRRHARCSARFRSSRAPTRPHSRRATDSSAHVRSARRTGCCRNREPTPSIGRFPRRWQTRYMPYQRKGEDAQPTPPAPVSDDADQTPAEQPQQPQITKARKSLWIIGFAIGGYMIISGIVQAIMAAQP